ncbi:MAG: aminoacyl-tRNA hydrolase [Deltaproteobacteria bacterium]|nr:aminoacyl-tRNA hydrolase [Deltaproteobacteria bacterium]MBW2672853.1 aminoacyl-tRNA hydrolase [Deltaproteobacteria bacterium]
MKLIAGLGNPGIRYSYSRHNIGFLVLDALALAADIEINRGKFDSYLGRGIISGAPVVLAKPQTFMNLSGVAVGKLARYFGIGTEEILIVHDDMDFPTGDVRIKMGGGAGGHKGLLSIIDHLGGSGFARIRVGIGRPPAGEMTEGYVLERFSECEIQTVPHVIERACDAVFEVVSSGVQAAMNRFNVRITQNSSEEV